MMATIQIFMIIIVLIMMATILNYNYTGYFAAALNKN